MVDITEYGDIMINPVMDEWGRTKIDSLLEDGTIIIVVVVPPVVTITAQSFPMLYLAKPVEAQELISKVEGATIIKIAQDYPERLLRSGRARELKSKFST